MNESATESIITIDKVDQSFRTGFWMKRVQILHQISLKIPRGAIYGFLGHNGAGKTTLIHILAGIRKPAAGKVLINGFESHTPLARLQIGYLPERPYFHEHLTGEGLLQYFGALAGLQRIEIDQRIPKILDSVGMSQARKTPLQKYSKGMLQRIGIAQALIHNPKIVILDEPMSGLDPLGRKEMRELILELAAEGRTIFFSSHVIPDVETICNQVAIIKKGKLIGAGPIGGFLSQGQIQTEIAFRGIELKDAKKMTLLNDVRPIPDGIRGVAQSQDAVTRLISQLLKQKAQILWVTPIRPSLEDLFQ